MRAVYFERREKSFFHIHAGSFVKGVYIPDKDVILYKESHGTFGGHTSSILEEGENLDAIKDVLKKKSMEINIDGVVYSNIREFECNEAKTKELIEKTRREIRSKDK